MQEKERNDNAGSFFEEKEDTDAHFENSKKDEKCSEVHEVNGGFEK